MQKKGAKEGKQCLNTLANFFAKRHNKYCELMNRIRAFVAKVKIEDQEMRRKKKKLKNPTADQSKGKVLVQNQIEVEAAQKSYNRPRLRQVQQRDFANEKDRQYGINLRNFLSHTSWTLEGEDNQGITWLELYILFLLHRGEGRTDWATGGTPVTSWTD